MPSLKFNAGVLLSRAGRLCFTCCDGAQPDPECTPVCGTYTKGTCSQCSTLPDILLTGDDAIYVVSGQHNIYARSLNNVTGGGCEWEAYYDLNDNGPFAACERDVDPFTLIYDATSSSATPYGPQNACLGWPVTGSPPQRNYSLTVIRSDAGALVSAILSVPGIGTVTHPSTTGVITGESDGLATGSLTVVWDITDQWISVRWTGARFLTPLGLTTQLPGLDLYEEHAAGQIVVGPFFACDDPATIERCYSSCTIPDLPPAPWSDDPPDPPCPEGCRFLPLGALLLEGVWVTPCYYDYILDELGNPGDPNPIPEGCDPSPPLDEYRCVVVREFSCLVDGVPQIIAYTELCNSVASGTPQFVLDLCARLQSIFGTP